MVDALIFDMDGTLVDWAKPITASWNETFARYGWNRVIDENDFRTYAGHTTAEIGALCFPNLPGEESFRRIAIASEEETAYIAAHATWDDTFLPGPTFLKELSKKYRLFIVSNCMAGYIDTFFSCYGGREEVEDYLDNRYGKSKWDNIKAIVEKHGLKSPIYIGDTIMDQEAAQKAGVPFVHATYGYGKLDAERSIDALSEALTKEF